MPKKSREQRTQEQRDAPVDTVGVLACIVCHKQPEAVDDENPDTPYAATEFDTIGHWGSTVWDPNDGSMRLEIVVCDECLMRAARRQLIAYTIHKRVSNDTSARIRRFWNPGRDESRDH